MQQLPAKLLKGQLVDAQPYSFVEDLDSPFAGYPNQWMCKLTLEPQPINFNSPDGLIAMFYTANNVKVGDWIATSAGGIASVINQIYENDGTNITVLVEDQDLYNFVSDPTQSMASIGPLGNLVVFEVDPVTNMPILGPAPVGYLDVTFQGDMLARFAKLNKLKFGSTGGGGSGDGSSTLVTPSTGTYDDGYIKGWEVGTTLVSDAFRQLNIALKEVGPARPPTLNQQFLDIEGGVSLLNTDPIVLAKNADDHSGDSELPAPGTVLKRVRQDTLNTVEIGPFGPGNTGGLFLDFNNNQVGAVSLDIGDNTSVGGLLEVTSDSEYPVNQPGVYEAITARGVGLQPEPGLNMVRMYNTSGASTRKVFFVYDTTVTKPTVINASLDQGDDTAPIMSSGIPHYGRGARLKVSGSVGDLATDIALGRRNVLITTTPVAVGPTTWLSNGSFGINDVFTKGGIESFTDAEYNIEDTDNNPAYGTVQISVTGRNANGSNEMVLPTKINVMRGGIPTELSFLEELNVPVYNLGAPSEGKPLFARRVNCDSTDLTPSEDAVFSDWDSTTLSAAHEASVVGGAAILDKNDYSKDFLPVGPDYSGKPDQQFITFAINRRAVSQMIIQIRGSYTRLFIKLPGIGAQPLSVNGWMDAMKLYDGSGVPGRDSEDGCALGKAGFGFDQDLRVTFGSESSSNSTDNLILVRFVLTEGNSIQALRFTGVN